MDLNPYQPSPQPLQLDSRRPRVKFLCAAAATASGLICGSLAGFVGGGLVGFTYRLLHDVVAGGDPILGVFERVANPLDFALYHGTIAAIPLGTWGAVLGLIEGIRAPRPFDLLGMIAFSAGSLLVGLINGAYLTGGPERLSRHLLEGPIAGALFGLVTGCVAWLLFRRVINATRTMTQRTSPVRSVD